MEKVALVLSGGGSKGAYEIGVYKALKQLRKQINITTGTSIGAINAIFVAQNDLKGAVKLWKNISFSAIYSEEDYPNFENAKLSEIYANHVKYFINEGGMDVSKMDNLFNKAFKPSKFFNSNIEYGLVTYNLSKNKPILKTKKDLNKDNIRDYVLASATCYPAFKPRIINNELFIDGGYYDNLPINLAISLGATEIIAVDLRAIGFKKDITDKSVDVTYIAPRNKIASFLIFDKKKAKETMKFGYNDAMKTFGKLDGNKFTFKKRNLIKNYNKYNKDFEKKLREIFNKANNNILNNIFKTKIFEEILNQKTTYKNFNYIVEKAGKIFNFEEFNIYNIRNYNHGLVTALSNTNTIDINKIISKVKEKKFNNLIDNRKIVKYFYEAIESKNEKQLLTLIPLFNDEFLVALYIYTIKNKRFLY